MAGHPIYVTSTMATSGTRWTFAPYTRRSSRFISRPVQGKSWAAASNRCAFCAGLPDLPGSGRDVQRVPVDLVPTSGSWRNDCWRTALRHVPSVKHVRRSAQRARLDLRKEGAVRVLVVEDDDRLASSLHRGLEEAGMAVDTVADGEEALSMALTASYDVIVLDVMLPSRDGFAVARSLREKRVHSQILMLTGRGAVEDRVHGLDVGTDDYPVKPFALRELIARIKALSRRHLPDRASVLAAGSLSLDIAAHRVTVAGSEVQLTAKEFSILEFFMLHRGQLLSREQILENVWDWDLEDGRNLVEVYIGRVRAKADEAGARAS